MLRSRIGPAALVLAGFCAGCTGSDDGAPITEAEARSAIDAVFRPPLVDNVITGPASTTKRIVASFTGGTARESLVAVVFTAPSAARAFTGREQVRRLGGPERVLVIRTANVVVLYTSAGRPSDSSVALRRSLRHVAADESDSTSGARRQRLRSSEDA